MTASNLEEFTKLIDELANGKKGFGGRKALTGKALKNALEESGRLLRDNPDFINIEGVNAAFVSKLFGYVNTKEYDDPALRIIAAALAAKKAPIDGQTIKEVQAILAKAEFDTYATSKTHLVHIITAIAEQQPALADTAFIKAVNAFIPDAYYKNLPELFDAYFALIEKNPSKVDASIVDTLLLHVESIDGQTLESGQHGRIKGRLFEVLNKTVHENLGAWEWGHVDFLIDRLEYYHARTQRVDDHNFMKRQEYATLLLEVLKAEGGIHSQAAKDRLLEIHHASTNQTFKNTMADIISRPVLPGKFNYQPRATLKATNG